MASSLWNLWKFCISSFNGSKKALVLYFKEITFFAAGFNHFVARYEGKILKKLSRCGSRIWSKGGAQLLRPKVANIAKWSCTSEASNLWLGSRAHLRALEAFGFLMLKYAISHILETLFLSFLTSILTPKVDKNRALEFTSINLRHFYILHLFFNLHEKVML